MKNEIDLNYDREYIEVKEALVSMVTCSIVAHSIREAYVKVCDIKDKPVYISKSELMNDIKRDFRFVKGGQFKRSIQLNSEDLLLESQYRRDEYLNSFLRDYKGERIENVKELIRPELSTYNRIQFLDLSGQLQHNSDQLLSELISNLAGCSVEVLVLSNNKITDEGLKIIAPKIRSMNYLHTLFLNHNKFGDDGIEALFHNDNYSTSLRILNISYNQLGKSSAWYIGRMFSPGKISNLEELSIGGQVNYHHSIDTFFISLIPHFLFPGSRKLKKLDIASSGLTIHGISALITLISWTTSIESLNMSRIEIESSKYRYEFILALIMNQSLQHLNIHQCGFRLGEMNSLQLYIETRQYNKNALEIYLPSSYKRIDWFDQLNFIQHIITQRTVLEQKRIAEEEEIIKAKYTPPPVLRPTLMTKSQQSQVGCGISSVKKNSMYLSLEEIAKLNPMSIVSRARRSIAIIERNPIINERYKYPYSILNNLKKEILFKINQVKNEEIKKEENYIKIQKTKSQKLISKEISIMTSHPKNSKKINKSNYKKIENNSNLDYELYKKQRELIKYYIELQQLRDKITIQTIFTNLEEIYLKFFYFNEIKKELLIINTPHQYSHFINTKNVLFEITLTNLLLLKEVILTEIILKNNFTKLNVLKKNIKCEILKNDNIFSKKQETYKNNSNNSNENKSDNNNNNNEGKNKMIQEEEEEEEEDDDDDDGENDNYENVKIEKEFEKKESDGNTNNIRNITNNSIIQGNFFNYDKNKNNQNNEDNNKNNKNNEVEDDEVDEEHMIDIYGRSIERRGIGRENEYHKLNKRVVNLMKMKNKRVKKYLKNQNYENILITINSELLTSLDYYKRFPNFMNYSSELNCLYDYYLFYYHSYLIYFKRYINLTNEIVIELKDCLSILKSLNENRLIHDETCYMKMLFLEMSFHEIISLQNELNIIIQILVSIYVFIEIIYNDNIYNSTFQYSNLIPITQKYSPSCPISYSAIIRASYPQYNLVTVYLGLYFLNEEIKQRIKASSIEESNVKVSNNNNSNSNNTSNIQNNSTSSNNNNKLDDLHSLISYKSLQSYDEISLSTRQTNETTKAAKQSNKRAFQPRKGKRMNYPTKEELDEKMRKKIQEEYEEEEEEEEEKETIGEGNPNQSIENSDSNFNLNSQETNQKILNQVFNENKKVIKSQEYIEEDNEIKESKEIKEGKESKEGKEVIQSSSFEQNLSTRKNEHRKSNENIQFLPQLIPPSTDKIYVSKSSSTLSSVLNRNNSQEKSESIKSFGAESSIYELNNNTNNTNKEESNNSSNQLILPKLHSSRSNTSNDLERDDMSALTDGNSYRTQIDTVREENINYSNQSQNKSPRKKKNVK